jgi:molybdenum cofactor cytidylyltransferase
MLFEKINTSVVILAAGNSSRMGSPKAFLEWNQGKSFLEKIAEEYLAFDCNEVIVVLNEETNQIFVEKNLAISKQIKIAVNRHVDYGRLYSIQCGITQLENSYCFIQNIDNPFVEADLLNELYNLRNENGFVLPVFKGKGGHPVLIGKEIIDFIKKAHTKIEKLNELLKLFKRIEVPSENETVLVNINTEEEFLQRISNQH